MTNVVANLAPVDQRNLSDNPRNTSTYISARVLAANTAESITIPANAKFVRLAVTGDVYYSWTGGSAAPANGSAATVPVDTDDGTACELVKVSAPAAWLVVPAGATGLSVITAATAAIVTASFYGL